MLLPFNAEIFFYPKPIDFRKQMDGLIVMVNDVLSMNPTSGQIFIFRNKKSDRIKVLYWDRNGFWLLYRRLESDKFIFPQKSDIAMALKLEQFQWLLSGLNIENHKSIKPKEYKHFC